jgi:alkylation response protein AidB-like acyl-CoA dehydrogenase
MPRTVEGALELARVLGVSGVVPGHGFTAMLWEVLASIAADDLGTARTVEPHLDALAILDQAPEGALPAIAASEECTWGVFASEGGGTPVTAHQQDGVWHLTGTKAWCSLASELDAALVTATTETGAKRLFALALNSPTVSVDDAPWVARGLSEIASGPVHFAGTEAFPVGDEGWYLSRPGFSWGGIGVAACWYGGAVGLGRALAAAAHKPNPDRLLLMHLGAVDELLHSARRALAEAAELVDTGKATGADGRLLAKRVRATVARVCEEVATRVGHALGPAPLAKDPEYSKRVADLALYVRQHHAERDQASLGEAVTKLETTPW